MLEMPSSASLTVQNLGNRRLIPVVHLDSFWFAGAKFRPTAAAVISS
jgi:hypothetical protein